MMANYSRWRNNADDEADAARGTEAQTSLPHNVTFGADSSGRFGLSLTNSFLQPVGAHVLQKRQPGQTRCQLRPMEDTDESHSDTSTKSTESSESNDSDPEPLSDAEAAINELGINDTYMPLDVDGLRH